MLVFPQPMESTRATAISYHVVIALLNPLRPFPRLGWCRFQLFVDWADLLDLGNRLSLPSL